MIRDLYALAAFYVAHPGHPLPDTIAVHHYVTERAEAEMIAAEFAVKAMARSDGAVQVDHVLRSPKTMMIMHVVWRGDDA